MGLFSPLETISPTKVISILEGVPHYGGDPTAAQAGTREHTLILNAIAEQINPTMFAPIQNTALPIESGHILSRDKPLTLTINPNLRMNLKPDMILESTGTNIVTCVEIKKNYKPTHLLQLVYGCMVATNYGGQGTSGILYLYGGSEHVAYTLSTGGRTYWNDAKRVAELVVKMLDLKKPKAQRRTENVVSYVNDLSTSNAKEQAVLIRQEMDNLWSAMARGLTAMLH